MLRIINGEQTGQRFFAQQHFLPALNEPRTKILLIALCVIDFDSSSIETKNEYSAKNEYS
jgi:hypothetical protein